MENIDISYGLNILNKRDEDLNYRFGLIIVSHF